jgi:hypothetical protein
VEGTNVQFTDYLSERPNTIPLEFGIITQAEFITLIKNLEPKSSVDIDGISNKMLKFLRFELATPLVHLFNLSINTGEFPKDLKTVELSLFLSQETRCYVITIGQFHCCPQFP